MTFKDLRFAYRLMLKSPGFTAVAVLSLALGIGANSAIFSITNGLLLRPLPRVGGQDQLVRLFTFQTSGNTAATLHLSRPDFEDYVALADHFSELATFFPSALSLGGERDRPELAWGYLVSGSYFDLLQVEGIRGRAFLPEEDKTPGSHPVVVVSDRFFQRRMGGDPDRIGETIRLNQQAFTVVGVAPPGFVGTELAFAPDIWVPMTMYETILPSYKSTFEERGTRFLRAVGRLRPGISVAQAQVQMETVSGELSRTYPDTNRNVVAQVVGEREGRFEAGVGGTVTAAQLMLFLLAGLLLLIACANVANLLLARNQARQREISLRLAVGAPRSRLIRQLLTESLLLALTAGIFGLALAWAASRLFSSIRLPGQIPVSLDVGLDLRVLAVTFAVSLVTGVLFGLVPALRASRPSLLSALKDDPGAVSQGTGKWLLRKVFVIVQVAVAFLLLIMAGLFVKSLQNAEDLDLGMEPAGVLAVTLDVGTQGYSEDRGKRFFEDLAAATATLPGVRSASLAAPIPLDIFALILNVRTPGFQNESGDDTSPVLYSVVDLGYFETLGTRILRGRAFNDADREESRRVVVVNERFTQLFWPGQDPIGAQVVIPSLDASFEVVGVAQDGKYRFVAESPLPYLYLPFRQNYRGLMSLLVRAERDPKGLSNSVLDQIRGMDPSLVILETKTLEEMVNGVGLLPIRAAAATVGAFGLLALLMASIGLYGVMAFNVEQRTREIGIRRALGATGRSVLGLMVRQGLVLTLVGLGIGFVLCLALTGVAATLLLGVSPTDPLVFLYGSLVLIVVALVACLLPAYRATRLNPTLALRYE